jgi:20S proteasome subunit beta 7
MFSNEVSSYSLVLIFQHLTPHSLPVQVNMIGTHFEESHIATGFGNHLAIPILREEWREDMTFEEAVKLIEKCLLVLLYRDRSSINKFQV